MPDCLPTEHISSGWRRLSKEDERELAVRIQRDLVGVDVQDRVTDTPLEREWKAIHREQLDHITRTGRAHIWERHCVAEGCKWAQSTRVDPAFPPSWDADLHSEVAEP